MRAFTFRGAPVVLLALAAVALAIAPAFATAPSLATETPRTGVGNYQPLTGVPQEFDFRYYGGNDPVLVQVGANPPGSVGFNVFTHNQWLDLAAGNASVIPVGRGTPNPVEPGNLFWRGASPEADLYHVQVFLQGSQPASFWISSSGSGAGPLVPISPVQGAQTSPTPAPATSTPRPTTAPTATATRLAATAQVTTTAKVTTAVTSTVPLTATVPVKSTALVGVTAQATVTPTATAQVIQTRAPSPTPRPTPATHIGVGNYQPIAAQPLEFDFNYYGGKLPVQVLVGASPAAAVGFNVYTDSQWRDLAAGDLSVVPVGRGTANAYEPGNLFWQGGSAESDLYHVQVFPLTSQPASFWIALQSLGTSGLTAILPAAPPAPSK